MTDIEVANLVQKIHILTLIAVVCCSVLVWRESLRAYVWGLLAAVFLSQLLWGACPLTLIEEYYRHRGGQQFSYGGSFVSYHMRQYFGVVIPPWVVTASVVIIAAICFGIAYLHERLTKK